MALGFRPLNGVLFYLHFPLNFHVYPGSIVFVPSTGFFSIYTLEVYEKVIAAMTVFVPSTGFFSIYLMQVAFIMKQNSSFRPLNGVLFYLPFKTN